MSFAGFKAGRNEEPKAILKKFIDEAPASQYTFDSERGADHSEICRQRKGQKECLEVWLNSKQMFEAMQHNGFFCALPMDPGRTHMDCKPIPKS
ncbi:hypothetical protein K439DRAFT_89040 [Ramaria rubella]|nr:hypothetical protein K439DRAFT_89040 [Ramaria rubella]